MPYIRGNTMTVSKVTRLYNTSTGIAAAVADGATPYGYITQGGYTPTPITGTPVDDDTKGSCKFFMYSMGQQGNAVEIVINGTPTIADGIPLNLYTADDDIEPWFQHSGPTIAGTFRCVRKFVLNGLEVFDEWQETWV